MKNILVLTDFSAPSDAAVDSAFQIVETQGGEITIYHRMTKHTNVIFQLNMSNKYSVYDITEKVHIKSLEEWSKRAEKNNIKVYFLSAGGELVEGVNRFCLKKDIDLVIMGSTGRDMKPKQWGSNTENMVKHINFPLLIIKEKINDIAFNKIVYASNFNTKEKVCFQKFMQLVPLNKNCEIHLVSIDTESFFTQPSILIHQAMDDYVEIAKPIKAKKHFYQDYTVRAGIRHFTEELKPDVVVMSNKMRKPIKRILLGNDAVEIAHTSRYPVLILNYPD